MEFQGKIHTGAWPGLAFPSKEAQTINLTVVNNHFTVHNFCQLQMLMMLSAMFTYQCFVPRTKSMSQKGWLTI